MSIRLLEKEFKKIDIKDNYIKFKYNKDFYHLLIKSNHQIKDIYSEESLLKKLCKSIKLFPINISFNL